MKMVFCECCGNIETEHRVHLERMDEIRDHFAREYAWALQEYTRLETLLRDVTWYNFETIARGWRHPWPESYEDSDLTLHAMRFELLPGRRGRISEKASFPIYYEGSVRDAPPLPPEIVLGELKLAHEHVKSAQIAVSACYDWAPGGRLYEKMLRESPGVAAFSSKESAQESNGGCSGKNGIGLLLGDELERQATTRAETTAKDILGRICGDRSLVSA